MYEVSTPQGPTQVTRLTPNPRINLTGHALLTFLFYGALAGYFVYAVLAYVNQEPLTVVALRSADRYPPVLLNLTVECTAPACGQMLFISNYTAFPSSPCRDFDGGDAASLTNGFRQVVATPGVPVPFALCYTAQEGFSMGSATTFAVSMIQVGFTNLTGTASLAVRSADGRVNRLLNIAPGGAVRSMQLGYDVETLDGAVTRASPFSNIVQFEGNRKVNRSDALIQMGPLANVRERTNARSAWALVSSVGSAFDTLQGVFLTLLPLWALIFAASRHKEDVARFLQARKAKSAARQQGYAKS